MASEKSDNAEYAWPTVGDQIFVSEGPHHSLACVNFGRVSEDAMRLRGFARAANILARSILEDGEGRHQQDSLIFPLLFLYRHAVELALKKLVPLAARWTCTDIDPKKVHHLPQFWSMLRPVLVELSPEEEPTVIAAADAMIRELDDIDPNATAFRYSTRKDNTPALPDTLRHIDTETAATMFEGLLHFLEAASDQLHHQLHVRDEYEWYAGEEAREIEREQAEEYETAMRDLYPDEP